MIKLIYLDIDGTLRDERTGIPKSAVQALEQCREKGIRIVICTGRNPGSVQDDVNALATDGMISGGGCYIRYHGRKLREQYFTDEALADTVSIADETPLSLAMETKDHVYMDEEASRFYREDFQHKIRGSGENRREVILRQNKIAYEGNLNELWRRSEKVHKICMFGEKGGIDRAEIALERMTERIQKRVWNGRWYLELLPKGCHKGEAVEWLNSRLGIPKRETMSFGDGENDIAMLKATGAAVAMGGSSPIVRQYASSVCETAAEDGIYKELVRQRIIRPEAGEGSV